MDRSHGHIITFYSYKGGAGRSMALANFAWILAASGRRVLAIDWDLEAPGLHRYFRPFLVDSDMLETDGLIDALWNLVVSALPNTSSAVERATSEDRPEVWEALEDATRRIDWRFPSGGYIDLLGAGRQGTTYSERVNSFDWKRFYELGGARILAVAKLQMRLRYDWVLIDSRTGVSDSSGICTIQMPETLVACFTLNRQSVDGVKAILGSVRAFRSETADGSAISFFPIATRIENAEQLRLEAARGYARSALAGFLPKGMQSRPREYWDKMEISYRPAYAFEEVLAAFGDATGATGAADTMLAQIETIAKVITDDETLSMPEIVQADRELVLTRYSFGSRTPAVTSEDRTTTGEADTEFLRGIRAKEQIWRTSKFRWSHLLSRRELDLLTSEDRNAFGRSMGYYHRQSERMQRLLRMTEMGGVITFLFGTVLTFLVLPWGVDQIRGIKSVRFWEAMQDNPAWTISLFYAFFVAWGTSALVWSLVVSKDMPYGVRLSQVFSLTLRGPFRREIRDYESDEKRLGL